MKRKIKITLALLLCLALTGCVQSMDTSLASENEGLLAQVESLTLALEEQEDTCAAHTAELAALQEELAGQQALLDGWEEQRTALEALETENETLRQSVAALEAQNQQLADEAAAALASAAAQNNASPAPAETTEQPQAEQASVSTTVWIPRTGAKYHSTSTCSNMKNPSQSTEDDAIARGYGKCSKCW